MRLRTIRAAHMADAMAILRAELGEEAVILGTRRVGGGVEVTAGQEVEDEPVLIAPESVPDLALPPTLRRHNLPAALAQRLAGAPLPAALAQEFRQGRARR
jgi:flagellar biosynthesis protein FlhF